MKRPVSPTKDISRKQLVWFYVAVVAVILACVWIGRAYGMGSTKFGTYTKAYEDKQDLKRWKKLCEGGGRYQAMAEAYDKHKPDPCNGVK